MQPRVLVTRRIYPQAVELLQQHFEVDYNGVDESLSPDDLLLRAAGKHGIVAQLTDKFPPSVLDRLDGVRVISDVSVGYDNIDVPHATSRGILVTNTPDVLTDTTADLAFALLMATARRIVEGHALIHAGKWSKWSIDFLVGQDIHHRTLGIFGLGRIGQAMAKRAGGFGMRILYHDAERAPASVESALQAQFVSKEELLGKADFISLHVPLNDATRKLIGEPELRLMKKTAILVNTARGPVVDEAALAQALDEGRIAGAGLDVFQREPEIHPTLLRLDNVVLTPHIGSATVATRLEMCMKAARNMVAALTGGQPESPVNPEALPR
jgi:gluconate 2-dehydrogenase